MVSFGNGQASGEAVGEDLVKNCVTNPVGRRGSITWLETPAMSLIEPHRISSRKSTVSNRHFRDRGEILQSPGRFSRGNDRSRGQSRS